MTNYIMKILISIVIVKFTFTSKNKKVLLYQILAFNQFNNLNLFKMNHLIIGIGLSLIIAIKVFNYNFKINLKGEYIVQVTIFYKNKGSNLRALLDTGNNLTTPFGNKPVFIVPFKSLGTEEGVILVLSQSI